MKTFKKPFGILLAALIVCTSLVLGACSSEGSESSDSPKDITYKVSVKDPLGKAYSSGIVVRFMQNGAQVAMQPCDENGTVEKTLSAGEYSVELAFTDGEEGYYYDKDITLSAEKNEIDVILSKTITVEPTELHAPSGAVDAYAVSEGCTYVKLDSANRNYFLFTPNTAGTYQFSVANHVKAAIGYYGAPHFVQEASVAEVTDNKFTISVSASMIGTGDSGTSVYVIGIDGGEGMPDCILCIERIGDPQKTVEDTPWTIYQTTSDLSDYVLPEGKEIKEFDLTAANGTYELVYNETDGFYHLGTESGPLVLVRLAEDCDYIACFQTILDRSGVSRYFFDDNDELVKKESYSECLLEYIEHVDENEGVYPLTEDLKYIIQQRGEYVGWWDEDSNGYLFKDDNGYNIPDINTEIAWLLMCCYIE